MAYVIAEPCIGTKDNSCVEVCPVDCIHPTPDEADYDGVEMLYIDPDECIDCDACVEACPVDAIVEDPEVTERLFTRLMPRMKERTGGYTRVLKIGPRLGDAAPMVLVELVDR